MPAEISSSEAESASLSDSRSPYQSSDWDQATKRTVVVILLIGMVIILWISRPILPMLVVSAIFAYILSPIVDLVERLRIPRSIGTIILFVLLLVGDQSAAGLSGADPHPAVDLPEL